MTLAFQVYLKSEKVSKLCSLESFYYTLNMTHFHQFGLLNTHTCLHIKLVTWYQIVSTEFFSTNMGHESSIKDEELLLVLFKLESFPTPLCLIIHERILSNDHMQLHNGTDQTNKTKSAVMFKEKLCHHPQTISVCLLWKFET